jgi:hypothetical protein
MASESTQQIRMRDQVFISYSHKEREWMEKFRAQLKVIQQTGRTPANQAALSTGSRSW